MSRGPAHPPVEKKRQVIARDGGSTPVQDLAGDWWMLLSAAERRPATASELQLHRESVAA